MKPMAALERLRMMQDTLISRSSSEKRMGGTVSFRTFILTTNLNAYEQKNGHPAPPRRHSMDQCSGSETAGERTQKEPEGITQGHQP